MIQKSQQQDIDREGRRLLRGGIEPLGWVLTGFEEDYGIDYDVQVFGDGSAHGLWFKIQLKSSVSSSYSADGTFVSLQLSIDHAKHYAAELRDPIFLIHADVQAKKLFWYAPQLDRDLIEKLSNCGTSTVTVRFPTSNSIPETASTLLEAIEKLYVVLGNRTLVNSSVSTFAESLKHQPDEHRLREEFHRKNDVLKLRRIHELFAARQYSEARSRAQRVVSDPDSGIENRFWAQQEIGTIDWAEAVSKNSPQAELPLINLRNSRVLQTLTKQGPSHLKFFALITRKAAELDQLAIHNWGLTILLHQHSTAAGNPVMALRMYAEQAFSTRRVIAKYNQCLRLTRYASNFEGRWVLPNALFRIVQSAASFIARVDRMGITETGGSASQFQTSVLEICKLISWIGEESGDQGTIALAVAAALLSTTSHDTDAFRWATRTLDHIRDPDVRNNTIGVIERQLMRWKGERPDRDFYRNPVQQLLENAAASLGIDLSDEDDPFVQGLQTAVRDNSPERVLKSCEHIVASLGATGPIARQIAARLGTQMAGSKILHCVRHNYHHEARDFDSALAEFKLKYCDSCPDRAPRPTEWKYTEEVRREFELKHDQFIRDFNATGNGFRIVPSD